MDSPAATKRYDTVPNVFGVYRRYSKPPQHEPDEGFTPASQPAAPTHLRDKTDAAARNPLQPFGAPVTEWYNTARQYVKNLKAAIAPFLNYSSFKLMWWQYTGSDMKSLGETQRLVDEVLLDDNFDREELRGFSAQTENRRLDEFNAAGGGAFTPETGWKEVSVKLKLPKAGSKHASEQDAPSVRVGGIWVRDLLKTLVAACQEPTAEDLHWWPSLLLRNQPDGQPGAKPQRIYTDFSNSTAFIKEHEAIQRRSRCPEDPPDLEYAVVPLLAQSDSTRLAQFGIASLWPIYLWFLSKCKYVRVMPSAYMAMHLAYVPHVSLNYRTKRATN